MAFSDTEQKKIESVLVAFLEKERPPEEIRPQLDLAYAIKGQSVELCEIRPQWNNPTKKMVRPYAKATYVTTQEVWKVYWQRADLKWHSYQPDAEVDSLEEFLAVVKADEYGCFYG